MLTIKSLHIIFIVTWFAAIFYLPRLFVYHSMSTNPVLHAQFQVMERKLFWGIATPSAVLTIIFGLWLTALLPVYVHQSWFWLKAAGVVLLLCYHVHCCFLMYRLRHNPQYHSHVWFRWYNEVPIVILIYIVFLVEFKPL